MSRPPVERVRGRLTSPVVAGQVLGTDRRDRMMRCDGSVADGGGDLGLEPIIDGSIDRPKRLMPRPTSPIRAGRQRRDDRDADRSIEHSKEKSLDEPASTC